MRRRENWRPRTFRLRHADRRSGLARSAGCSESEKLHVPELPPHALICGLERSKSFFSCFAARTVSQTGRALGATAEKAVRSLDAVRALPPMISRSPPMPVASSSSRRSGIWPTLGYAALAAIVLAIPNKRPGERRPADRGRPASSAMGTTRSTDEPREVQHQRAHEPGRGRHATAPWQIPWAGWKDILSRTYQQINEDRVLAVAAGVVFYALLAIFPAITAMVSLYGLFAKASTINEHLSLVAGFLPGGAVEIVQEQVNRLVSKGDAKLGIRFIFGLAVALWSANAGMKAIMDALNVVYDEKEKRGFIKLNLLSLAFTPGCRNALCISGGSASRGAHYCRAPDAACNWQAALAMD
jgi:Virulence factor BrkB